MSLSPIFAFFSQSPPASPTHAPRPAAAGTAPKHKPSHTRSTSVTLFTHQDGKNFEVAIVRLDDGVPAANVDPDLRGGGHGRSEAARIGGTTIIRPREEDWDSDDWDNDAEDLDFTIRRLSPAMRDAGSEADHGRARREERQRIDEWDGNVEDLEVPPVAAWAERLERPEWVRRQGDADVWRTRLAEY